MSTITSINLYVINMVKVLEERINITSLVRMKKIVTGIHKVLQKVYGDRRTMGWVQCFQSTWEDISRDKRFRFEDISHDTRFRFKKANTNLREIN
jgi:hypothetical protein